jgi:alpha-glucosidase
VDSYEGALPSNGWPNWVLGNHDNPRIASRIGVQQARVAAMMLLTLRGTPTIYYGDEIGMQDVAIPPDEVQDPQGLNMPGKYLSRDPARTPMQWDDSKNAGFTNVRPWLRLAGNFKKVNVKRQMDDEDATLMLYKRLIGFRQKEPALTLGNYRPVFADNKMIAYIREYNNDRFLIVLNLTHSTCYFSPDHLQIRGKVELATHPELEGTEVSGIICLAGDEGMIVRLEDVEL